MKNKLILNLILNLILLNEKLKVLNSDLFVVSCNSLEKCLFVGELKSKLASAFCHNTDLGH